MQLDAAITVGSILVFAGVTLRALSKVLPSLFARRSAGHRVEIEIDGKVIEFDPTATSQANTNAIESALSAINKAHHPA